jgi:hypothetical protein
MESLNWVDKGRHVLMTQADSPYLYYARNYCNIMLVSGDMPDWNVSYKTMDFNKISKIKIVQARFAFAKNNPLLPAFNDTIEKHKWEFRRIYQRYVHMVEGKRMTNCGHILANRSKFKSLSQLV